MERYPVSAGGFITEMQLGHLKDEGKMKVGKCLFFDGKKSELR